MKRLLTTSLALASVLAAPAAFACGMPYGDNTGFNATQSIVVSHHDGIERYQFAPSFCGQSTEFGMILPIPSDLTGTPQVGDPELAAKLQALSEPIYDQVSSGKPCSDGGGGPGNGTGGGSGGVDVIDRGTVGDTDYSVISADSIKALTDWLDANKYPYDDAAKAGFEVYVQKKWRFVTFKISAGDKPEGGKTVCGNLQPIVLNFKADVPVVPTRIVTAGFADWTIYTVASKVLESKGTTRIFAGAVTEDLADKANPGKNVASVGDQLTRVQFSFGGGQAPTSDLEFTTATDQSAYRATVTIEVCGPSGEGGAGGAGGSNGGTGGTGATGGSSPGKGGSSGASGQGGAGTSDAPAAAPGSAEGGGCSTGSGGGQGSGVAGLLGLAVGLMRRRRR